MKLNTLEILTCPNCGNSPPKLETFQQGQNEVIEGNLQCLSCKKGYPIKNGIVRMISEVAELDKEHQK